MFEPYAKGAGILRYRVWPGEPVDEFALEMLQQNTPDGVLLLGREQTEEGDWLLLPVSGLIPVLSEEFIVANMFTKDKFLTAVKATRDSLAEYMIAPETLVLRPEWTWVRPETGAPVLPVLPVPSARDLSLSFDDYATLIGRLYERRGSIATEPAESAGASAKKSAKRRAPAKPWRRIVQDFWENLD